MKREKIKFYSKLALKKKIVLVNVCLGVTMGFITYSTTHDLVTYNPLDKKEEVDNLFKDDEIIISEARQATILQDLGEELKIKIPDDNDNYFLLDAVLKNEYLNTEEKEIFYKYIDYFNDNPYLDKEDLYQRLLTVDSQFSFINFVGNKNLKGCYLEENNDIVYFQLFPSELVKAHEQGHVIGTCDARWLNEGMQQLIVNEYILESPFTNNQYYFYETNLVKFICELIDPDIVLKAYTTNNVSLIYDALGQIYGSSVEAEKALVTIDEYFKCILEQSTEKIQDDKNFIMNLYDAYDLMLNYFTKCSVKDSQGLYYTFSHLLPKDDDSSDNLKLEKAYFSSKLKNKGYQIGRIFEEEKGKKLEK